MLDAVRDRVLAVGVRRTTLTDVARRAGVSRMTLYRRYPDVTSLVADLMTREFGALLRTEDPRAPAGSARDRLVARCVHAIQALRASPLLRKVIDVDPELLLPYVIDRLGGTQRIALDFLTEQLRAGHADGSIRPGDPDTQARTLLLVAQSYVLSLDTTGAPTEPLYDELAVLLTSYLEPR